MSSVKRSKFLLFDAFTKTDEDVRVRTNSGGIITLACMLVTVVLLLKEYYQLTEIVTKPQLYVDRDADAKLALNFDITFPHISCDVLTLDIVDEAGELQLDMLDAGFTKTRCSPDGKELATEDYTMGTDYKPDQATIQNRPADYCGSCYGAGQEGACCRTCDDVHKAYLDSGWAFYDGANIEQCEQEGYVKHMNDHINEGCRVRGSASLSRIRGNIHFVPGKSYLGKKDDETIVSHKHDMSLYNMHRPLNFNHIIHHLSFGQPVTDVHKKMRKSHSSEIVTSPLDGREVSPDREAHNMQYSYFAKIVPTRYEYLNDKHAPVETTQFSATFHSRPIMGGRDQDHPTTFHSRGGFPGVFFYYEMSALKVINREQHAQTFAGFLLNCITTIGGILAVGTIADRLLFKAQISMWPKKSQ